MSEVTESVQRSVQHAQECKGTRDVDPERGGRVVTERHPQ